MKKKIILFLLFVTSFLAFSKVKAAYAYFYTNNGNIINRYDWTCYNDSSVNDTVCRKSVDNGLSSNVLFPALEKTGFQYEITSSDCSYYNSNYLCRYFYAIWSIKKFNITLDNDGCGNNETLQIEYNSNYGQLPTPSCDSREFNYYERADGTRIYEDTPILNEDETLYANFNNESYTVTFDYQGVNILDYAGFNLDDNNLLKKEYEVSKPFGAMPVLDSKDGEMFAGWYDTKCYSNKKITPNTKMNFTSDKTLIPCFKNQFSIDFETESEDTEEILQGDYWTMGGYNNKAYKTIDKTTSSTYGPLPEVIKEGNIFLGWYSDYYASIINENTPIPYLISETLNPRFKEVGNNLDIRYEKNNQFKNGRYDLQEIKIYDGDYKLKENKDYYLNYFNPFISGEVKVEVQGINKYKNQNILFAYNNIEPEEITYTSNDYIGNYDGEYHTITLNTNPNYIVKYADENYDFTLDEAPQYKDIGKYVVLYKIIHEGIDYVIGSNLVVIGGIVDINTNVLTIDDDKLIFNSNISDVSEFINLFTISGDSKLLHLDSDGKTCKSDKLKTGDFLQININNKKYVKYKLVMIGDTNGDGKVSSIDYLNIRNHVQNVSSITNELYLIAADYNKDNNIDENDYLSIKEHILSDYDGGNNCRNQIDISVDKYNRKSLETEIYYKDQEKVVKEEYDIYKSIVEQGFNETSYNNNVTRLQNDISSIQSQMQRICMDTSSSGQYQCAILQQQYSDKVTQLLNLRFQREKYYENVTIYEEKASEYSSLLNAHRVAIEHDYEEFEENISNIKPDDSCILKDEEEFEIVTVNYFFGNNSYTINQVKSNNKEFKVVKNVYPEYGEPIIDIITGSINNTYNVFYSKKYSFKFLNTMGLTDLSYPTDKVEYNTLVDVSSRVINNNYSINKMYSNMENTTRGYIQPDYDSYLAPKIIVKYIVEEYLEKVDASGEEENEDNYTLISSKERTGLINFEFTVKPSKFYGFITPSDKTITLTDDSVVVKFYHKRKTHTLTLVAGEGVSSVSGSGTYKFGQTVQIDATMENKYIFYTWKNMNNSVVGNFVDRKKTQTIKILDEDIELKAMPSDKISYVVYYYLQNLDGTNEHNLDNYTLKNTVYFYGKLNTSVTGDLRTYDGFITPEAITKILTPNDNEYHYYYDRGSYHLVVNNTNCTNEKIDGYYKYEQNVEITCNPEEGYTFKEWDMKGYPANYATPSSATATIKMGYQELILTPVLTPKKVNVTINYYLAKLGADESIHDLDNYELKYTKNSSVDHNSSYIAPVNTYTGFNKPEAQTITVLINQENVVNYYYTRKELDVYTSIIDSSQNDWIESISPTATVKYGESYDLFITLKEGYAFDRWIYSVDNNLAPSNYNNLLQNQTVIINDRTVFYPSMRDTSVKIKYIIKRYLQKQGSDPSIHDEENYTPLSEITQEAYVGNTVNYTPPTISGYKNPEPITFEATSDKEGMVFNVYYELE